MAVRVSKDHGIISMDLAQKTAVVKLFADEKEDVTDDIVSGEGVDGMPEGYTMDAESYVVVADGNIAQLKTDGSWKFVGEKQQTE